MPRSTQQLPTANAPSGFGAAEQAEMQRLVEELDGMLNRLRLGAIREQLDALLEEAARRQLNLREALAWLCAAEVANGSLYTFHNRRPMSLKVVQVLWAE